MTTAEQRDALYDRFLDRLSGIEDVWLAASSADYDTAGRLGREYSDELRLVLGREAEKSKRPKPGAESKPFTAGALVRTIAIEPVS